MAKQQLGKELLLEMYRKMVLIRRFEEKAGQQYQMAKIAGFCHLYIGQEAVAVGSLLAVNPEDYAVGGYRDHGYPLVRGAAPGPIMAELFGKRTGSVKGKGGSMHIIDKSVNFLGGYGIVGGQIPLATGAGFAIKYKGERKCVICYLGDAAVNQGAFLESLNMASLWKLPVIYIIENNRYGMGTPISRSIAIKDLYKRADAFTMAGVAMNGMDVLDCYKVTREAAERAWNGEGPTLIEARTYRFRGHSMADPQVYRTKEEVEEERKRDPIVTLGALLLEKKHATQEDLEKIDEEAKAAAEEAVKFADESPEPSPDEIYEDIYSSDVQVDRLRWTGQA